MPFSPLRKSWKSAPSSRRRRKQGWALVAGSGLESLEERLAPATSATTTALTSTVRNPAANQPVTLTATVAQSTSGVAAPTGTVDFFDNGNALSTVTLNANKQAVLLLPGLPLGTNTITADYEGDANNTPSPSAQVAILSGGSNELFLNQVFLTVFRADRSQLTPAVGFTVRDRQAAVADRVDDHQQFECPGVGRADCVSDLSGPSRRLWRSVTDSEAGEVDEWRCARGGAWLAYLLPCEGGRNDGRLHQGAPGRGGDHVHVGGDRAPDGADQSRRVADQGCRQRAQRARQERVDPADL